MSPQTEEGALSAMLSPSRPTVTSREASRALRIPLKDAQMMLMAEYTTRSEELCISFTVTTTDRKNDGSVEISVKKFSSWKDAEEYAVSHELCASDAVAVHSVSMKPIVDSISYCQLIERKSSHIAAGGASRDVYPTLSRQATMEKQSSGNLGERSKSGFGDFVVPVNHHRSEVTPAATPTVAAPANKPLAAPTAHQAPVPPKPAPPSAPTSNGHATTPLVIAAAVDSQAKGSSDHVVASHVIAATAPPAATHSAAPATVTPVITPPVSTPPVPKAQPATATGGKVQKSLFDMMNVKRPREEGAGAGPSAPKPPPKPADAPKPTAKKGRPAKPTNSLATLAKRSSVKGVAVSSSVNSALFDDDEPQDSDDERAEQERRDFIKQAKSAAKARPPPVDDFAVGDDAILPTVDDHFELCIDQDDHPQAAPAECSQPASVCSSGFQPTPSKRPREPEKITGNLNSFFNSELLAFQKKFSKEHSFRCTEVKGEQIYSDVVVYRNLETKEEVSADLYNAMQKEIVDMFEARRKEEKLQKSQEVVVPSTATEASASVATKASVPVKPKVSAQKASPAASAPKTLFSYFGKKS